MEYNCLLNAALHRAAIRILCYVQKAITQFKNMLGIFLVKLNCALHVFCSSDVTTVTDHYKLDITESAALKSGWPFDFQCFARSAA